MTFAAAADLIGRIPIQVVEIDADQCSLTFGVAPCTAALGAVGKCYNTRITCQDTPNYTRSTTTLQFVEPQSNLPAGESFFPQLVAVTSAPTKLTPGKGLGFRASVTVTLQDETHHDRGVDPYPTSRTNAPAGTFWTRWLARNPHYNGRTLRVRSGYVTDPWDWNNFDDREYVIERIEGPDALGVVRIIAKDILKLADDNRATCPVATTGALTANLAAGASSTNVTAGTGSQYTAGEYVRIGDEIILVNTIVTDAFTSITRGQWGTTDEAHSQDDNVQQCQDWQSVNVRDIIDTLLTTFAGISSSYITAADWDTEETDWLSAYDLTAIISVPTGVNTLLGELMQQCQLMVWWDDRAQQIRLKAVVPPKGNVATTLNDDEHFIFDSVGVKDNDKDRISQLWTYYDKKDYTEDKRGNFQLLSIRIDSDAESADEYGDSRIEVIESRWFDENNADAILQTESRSLSSRRNTPKIVKFSLDAKDLDDYSVGDVVDLVTDNIVDFDGNPKTIRGILVEENEVKNGHRIDYTLQSGVIASGRFAFIGPNTLNDYSAESDANRAAYGFIGPNTGNMPDGEERYKIA